LKDCRLKAQGYEPGSCLVETDGKRAPACRVALKQEYNQIYRLITTVHLSRPENYLSIYQSGCNLSCRKCHSWYFSKHCEGSWFAPGDILKKAAAYEKSVTLVEPRYKATAWHAHESCRCCGSCILHGEKSSNCPGVLDLDAIVVSRQGFGPARNIVAFTGGDLTCCPEFYARCARLIKSHTQLWVLIETNGYGLTPKNLDVLKSSGVDAFWLDIKGYDARHHKWLTGCGNSHILRLAEEMRKRDFILEVLSLYIPELVEAQELEMIGRHLNAVDPAIPFTILAFFPEYKMKDFRTPTVQEMVAAYQRVKATGMQNVRLGNMGVFVRTRQDQAYFAAKVDRRAWG
jgi:pyruvate-formate lyase-activating enzyme